MNVSLNYFRKHVSKNIFSENIIKFYGGTNEMAISKDMIIADLIALDPNYAAILMACSFTAARIKFTILTPGISTGYWKDKNRPS